MRQPRHLFLFATIEAESITEQTDNREASDERGIYEETDAPEGIRVFKSIDSRGVRRERRELCAADLNRSTLFRILEHMEDHLDEVDPVDSCDELEEMLPVPPRLTTVSTSVGALSLTPNPGRKK